MLVVALTALCGLTASTFADVQNIRLSGDLRLRGYYLSAAGTPQVADYSALDATVDGKQKNGSSQFIVQRTRVSVEADLEDHVLVVVTLKAEGIWGQDPSDSAGRTTAVGVQEAYVQLRELFYTPATLKAGRQFLNYGDGLILSSANQNYTFDAGRLVLDYHPLVIDVVAGQVSNPQGANPNQTLGQTDLLFLNVKYDGGDSAVKAVEAYFGWMPQDGQWMAGTYDDAGALKVDANGNPLRNYRALDVNHNNPSPMIIGLRTDLAPVEGLTMSLEGAYELGDNGGFGSTAAGNLSAWLAKAAVKYSMKNVTLAPSFNASYTFASGGGANGRNSFLPWFDDVDGYNGYLFQPQLSNIQIINLGASIKPCANTTLAVQGYYYMKADKSTDVYSNPQVDFGGPSFANAANWAKLHYGTDGTDGIATAQTGSREVGWELDGILGYDYSKDVRCQLVYAAFIPDNTFANSGGAANRVASEVRGEINVKF